MLRYSLAIPLAILSGCGGTVASATTAAPDAGTDRAAPIAASSCAYAQIGWGWDGGLGPGNVDVSMLTDCLTYVDGACTAPLPQQGSAGVITQDQIKSALADPDVASAFAGSVALYGSDPRGCDGALLRITIGARSLEVGGDCSMASSCGMPPTACVPTPPGLAALAQLLPQLDTQELASPSCSD